MANQPALRVQKMRVDDLVPYAGNAKEHPEDQIEDLANSIKQFGFCDPVGVWHDEGGEPVIVEGHGRVLAARALGMEEIPCITLDHLDDEGRRAYTLAHNQLTLTSGFDMEILQAELDAITSIDMGDLGFELEPPDMLEEGALGGVDEDAPPEDAPPRVSRGEVWQMGDHLLMCGDATSLPDMAKLLRGGVVVDLLLTDPPYNVDYEGKAGTIENDAFSDEQAFRTFIADALTAASEHMAPGAAFYVWFASTHSPALYGAARDAGLTVRQELEWVKNHFTLGRQDYQWMHEPCLYGWKEGAAHYFAPTRCETTVYEDKPDLQHMKKPELLELCERLLQPAEETTALHFDKPLASEEHPTMKPVKLFARLIRNSSRPGDTVLDPFGGSGTTVVACEQMGRSARVMELDPRYCDVILARWEKLTGGEATRLA